MLGASAETRKAFDAWLDPTRFGVEHVELEAGATLLERCGHRLVLIDLVEGQRYDPKLVEGASRNRRRGGLPVVLIIPEAGHPDVRPLFLAGARDTIYKPLREPELVGRLWFHRNRERRRALATRQEETLQALLELTHTLVSPTGLPEALHSMLRRLAEIVQIDRASIVVAPSEGDAAFVVASSDDTSMTQHPIRVSDYPELGHVLDARQALTIGEVASHPLMRGVSGAVIAAGHRSMSLLPIMWQDDVMGALFLRAARPRGMPNRAQLDLCQVVTNATAIALRNARMPQALEEDGATDAEARAEVERRLSDLKRYADLLSSSVDGVIAFEADGRLIFGNPSAYAILGYTEEMVMPGTPLQRVILRESRKEIRALLQGFTEGKFPRDVDLHVRHRDRRKLVISGSFSPLQGTRGAVLFSFRDVTEARRTDEELVQTRNFLQSLVNASVDAIVAADMDGRIVLFNEGAQSLYGYSEEEGLAMNVRALYPGDAAREVMRLLRSDLLGGYGRLEPVRMEAIDSSGEIFPISLTSAFIYEDGEPTASFGIFTDLRDKIRVEEQLAQAQEQLAMGERQSLLAELAGATAHELNQPLTSIMGSAELLQRRLDDPDKARASAKLILEEAQRMADIVKKIGQLTEYETKSYVGEQRIIDLHTDAKGPLESTLPPRPPTLPPNRPPESRASDAPKPKAAGEEDGR